MFYVDGIFLIACIAATDERIHQIETGMVLVDDLWTRRKRFDTRKYYLGTLGELGVALQGAVKKRGPFAVRENDELFDTLYTYHQTMSTL